MRYSSGTVATSVPHARRRFTVADVERMADTGVLAEGEHIELLDGELIEMPPQGPIHASLSAELQEALLHVYGNGFAVREAKPMTAGESQLPEPDLAVFRGSHKQFRERHPRGDEAVLVVELARTSLAIDHEKANVYARAGVPTYWIMDLVTRRLEVHEEPQPDGRYRLVRVLAGDDRVTLPETTVEWRIGDLLA